MPSRTWSDAGHVPRLMSPIVISGASVVAHTTRVLVPWAQTPPCVVNHWRLAPGSMSVTGSTQAVAP